MPQTTRDPKSEGLRFISARRQLAHTIRSSLLGVLPMDQEIQLEDRDWRLILVALEANMQNPTPSCDAPSCGCVDGEDCRANVAPEERRAAGRVMIRAVRRQLGDGHRDDDGNAVWVIDRTATAHGAPFSRGDIVIDSDGWSGFREVLEVQLHPSEQRLLRLVVRRVDGLVFDEEEF